MTNDLRLHDNKSWDHFIKSPENDKAVLFFIDPAFRGSKEHEGSEGHKERFNKRAFTVFKVATDQLIKIFDSRKVRHITVTSQSEFDKTIAGNDVIISYDTSPFARARESHIRKIAKSVMVFDTKHLMEPTPKKYKVFGPYYKDRLQLMKSGTVYKTIRKTMSDDFGHIKLYEDAFKSLKKFDPDKYARTAKASILVRSGATDVSWALARGIMSAREVYEHCRKVCNTESNAGVEFADAAMDQMFRELIFRDFYSRVTLWYLPKYGTRFRNEDVTWKITSFDKYLAAIKKAPEVIQVIYKALVTTGKLSNYGRMLFATWTYDIGADWTLGELLFARELLDYDFSSNHWNWAHHSIQGFNYQWPEKKFKIELVKIFT